MMKKTRSGAVFILGKTLLIHFEFVSACVHLEWDDGFQMLGSFCYYFKNFVSEEKNTGFETMF